MALLVTKRNGTKEPYDEKKVVGSIVRANVSRDVIVKILDGLKPILVDGVTTDQIYDKVSQLLKKNDISYAYKYKLRESLGKLIDEERFEFEKFVQNLFAEEGYDAIWQPQKAQGFCIDHQIDVALPQERVLIECKHHHSQGRMTGVGEVLETWARLYDLKEGYSKKINGAVDIKDFWLVVNTKFSEYAKRYAKCKGMTLIGWGTEGRSIEKMMEKTKCFPITILPITDKEHELFSKNNIVSTKSFENLYKINDQVLFRIAPKKRIDELYTVCQKL